MKTIHAMEKSKSEDEIKEVREQSTQLATKLIEAKNKLLETQDQLIKLLNEKVYPVAKADPVNYDSPEHDEFLNKQVDDLTIVKGIASQVYYGRLVTVQLMGNGSIELRQQSHHLVQASTDAKHKYNPIRETLSQETFFLILEAMEFAEKKFGLDRKAIIEKLTGGGELNFKDAITVL